MDPARLSKPESSFEHRGAGEMHLPSLHHDRTIEWLFHAKFTRRQTLMQGASHCGRFEFTFTPPHGVRAAVAGAFLLWKSQS
jgi:hypothetical protein